MLKRIHGEGGGRRQQSSGGGNQTVNVVLPTPVFTPDAPELRSTSFAQLQFLLCEGEILGPVGGNTIAGLEQSVYLDNTPVRVGGLVSPQPSDLVFSWGRPASQQTGVPGFGRISTVVGVDKQVKLNLPISQTITSPDPSTPAVYARVILTFSGLVDTRSNGDVLPGVVGFGVQYQDAAGTLYTAFSGVINGKFSGAFQREYEFLLQGVGPWRIVVTRDSPDDDQRSSGGNSYRSDFSFSSVVVSLDQRLSYPYSSMLSLSIRADQYSSLPAVAVEVFGQILKVPSNYDTVTRTYAGIWDGTFKAAYSNNPAWVLYDLINNKRFGLGEYVEPWQADKWTLYTIARYCDEQVPAAGGGTEPRFTCNLILQTAEQAYTLLQQLSSIFRGFLYYAGGYIIAIQDRPLEPVFTFNESNTIEQFDADGKVSAGNFSYAGAAKRARSTVVLASWDDPLDNYQPRVEYVADEIGIARFGYKPKDLRLLGVTSRGQALRAARATLLAEAALDDTVTFSTNEIGAAVRPGDRVKIADPNKAARRYGGRIKSVNGAQITLDDAPVAPLTGWAGATFSFMAFDLEKQPTLIKGSITAVNGAIVTVAGLSQQPAPGIPWLIETPDRTAQDFRILTVEEQEGGVYAFTALRYRADLFAAIDYDTPLNDNEDYLFKSTNPSAPTINRARVIWDNAQAKIDVEWTPAPNANLLAGFDVSVKEFRLEYQAGALQPNGSIVYDGVWREVARQRDNREQIPVSQFVATDRFKIRICAVGRLGAQSPWATADVEDIQVGSPMPDLGGTHLGTGQFPSLLPNATLTHLNQSSGAQLFSWTLDVAVPAYVTGVLLEGQPDRPLNSIEADGSRPPTADGWYELSSAGLRDYKAITFHAACKWRVRVSLLTAIPGITGTTYAFDQVERAEIVPPPVKQFVVVTEPPRPSTPLTRRFSWDLDVDVLPATWPTGVVTDIVAFDVRYKAGRNADWDLGFPLFSDGIAGDQRWFETTLFGSGVWTVMIRSRDRTGWLSDTFDFIALNLGDALPTNVVERIDCKQLGFPGALVNAVREFKVDELFYATPLTARIYRDPQDDEFYEGFAGNTIKQVDAAEHAAYTYPLTVTENGVGLVVYTYCTGTYRVYLRKVGATGSDLIYPAPTADLFYTYPLSAYFYRDVTPGVARDAHPLAPFELVDAGDYEITIDIMSVDGVTPAVLWDLDVVFDYPDIVETINDRLIPAGGARVQLTQAFQELKAVNITLQESAAGHAHPANAVLSGKDRQGFTVNCFDRNGHAIEGLIDAICVGY